MREQGISHSTSSSCDTYHWVLHSQWSIHLNPHLLYPESMGMSFQDTPLPVRAWEASSWVTWKDPWDPSTPSVFCWSCPYSGRGALPSNSGVESDLLEARLGTGLPGYSTHDHCLCLSDAAITQCQPSANPFGECLPHVGPHSMSSIKCESLMALFAEKEQVGCPGSIHMNVLQVS